VSLPSPQPSLMGAAGALLLRDVRLLWRRRGDAAQPVLFALLVVTLFALALGGEQEPLRRSAPAVLWLSVLLAGLLSLDTLFRSDAEDGSLEQWLLSPLPLAWLVAVRVSSHWLTTAFPLVLVSPLGTPLLSLLGAVVAALTVGMRRAGILLALLVLPLYVPVLVFGAGAVTASSQGLDSSGALLMLASGLAISVLLAPVAAAAAIRIAIN